ncbi:MAG: hypothetical protein J4A00_02535 [Gammaproteobacteria bacterium]|nr:hypothetical protein [Gammaproteobacteria bacterium]
MSSCLQFAAEMEGQEYKPEEVRFFDPTKDLFQVGTEAGLSLRHWNGPNMTYIGLRVNEGLGHIIPPSISRHGEDGGYVIRGSIYYKAGYDGEYTKVLRAGDAFMVPACAPHAVIFGWDNNEETVLVASTADKATEYGEEGQLPIGFSSKATAGEINAMVVTPECRAMKSTPPVTWTAVDMPRLGSEERSVQTVLSRAVSPLCF